MEQDRKAPLTERQADRKALAKRLKVAMKGRHTIETLAAATGTSVSGVKKWLSGNTDPGWSGIVAAAAACQVSLDWLATGQEPMRLPSDDRLSNQDSARPAPLDEDLHGLVVEGVMDVYKEANARLPPRELGRLAARIYTDVVAACEGDDEDPVARRAALRMALQQLRRDLQAPVTGDQSKRRA